MNLDEINPRIAANISIAVEHMVLRALDFDLGTCWIRLMEEEKIREIFSWNENIYPIALLPLGYPDESPSTRKRLKIEDIMID